MAHPMKPKCSDHRDVGRSRYRNCGGSLKMAQGGRTPDYDEAAQSAAGELSSELQEHSREMQNKGESVQRGLSRKRLSSDPFEALHAYQDQDFLRKK